ncbi:hypothetical protein MTBUT4_190009 [Magnetospirillum sp. UT-4]|nr:hypothetical protein MTBUT4_190009 [Magnetospirillum sp. UT-4]
MCPFQTDRLSSALDSRTTLNLRLLFEARHLAGIQRLPPR